MSLVRNIFAVLFGLFVLTSAAAAQTVNVLVLQEDWDEESVQRDNRIQRSMLIEFQKVLNAPAFQRQMQEFGIQGLNVYDETALAMEFYDTNRVRRSDEELIELVRNIPNVNLDAMILYTFFARAVKLPNTGMDQLQASVQYRVINVKGGQILAADTVRLDPSGTVFRGCASQLGGADPHCVKEFVAENAEQLAADAANRIALQIGALLGQAYGGSDLGMQAPSPGINDSGDIDVAVNAPIQNRGGGNACANIPADYIITFKGVDQTQMNAIEEFMSSWACAINVDMLDSSLSQIKYTYRTRADRQRVVRNIRQMSEMMGIMAEPSTVGQNEIVVEAFPLRRN